MQAALLVEISYRLLTTSPYYPVSFNMQLHCRCFAPNEALVVVGRFYQFLQSIIIVPALFI